MNDAQSFRDASGEVIKQRKVEPPISRRLQKNKLGRFVKGPIPYNWITRASQLPGRSLHVGLCLWYLVGLQKQTTVKIPTSVLKEFGISTSSMHRALAWLEGAELISVLRQTGRKPIITVLTTPD